MEKADSIALRVLKRSKPPFPDFDVYFVREKLKRIFYFKRNFWYPKENPFDSNKKNPLVSGELFSMAEFLIKFYFVLTNPNKFLTLP